MAINLDERNVKAYFGLGLMYLKTERFNDAISNFSEVIRINKENHSVYTQIAIAYINNDKYEEALRYIEEAEKLTPSQPLNKFRKA